MSGARGIFLDSIHPLIIKRLDADTKALSQMGVDKKVPGQRSADIIAPNRAYQYFAERSVWMRVTPFAIPQTTYTIDPNYTFPNAPNTDDNMSGYAVPQWRDWVMWGTKSANIHGIDPANPESEQTTYGNQVSSDGSEGKHSSLVEGWGTKHGLYRRTTTAWDGTHQSGVMNSPVPGVTALQVSNKGDLGTIRRASFDIKCHSLQDLEAIEMMYMVPGLSVLVEWGWYHPELSIEPIDIEMIKSGDKLASTTLINTEIMKKSFGIDDGNIGDPTGLYNLEELANQNHGVLGPKAGIYDGLLGVVTKFNWTNDGQGGYDCRIDVISPGSLALGIPADSYNLGGSEVIDGESIPVTDLRTIITSIKKETRKKEQNVTNAYVTDTATTKYKTIQLAKNTKTGTAILSDVRKGPEVTIDAQKLSTAEYGVKISLSSDGESLEYTKVDPTDKESVDYYLDEYKAGERQKVQRIYGDRGWWNRIIAYATGRSIGRVGPNSDYTADEHRLNNGKKLSVEDLQDKFDSGRCDKIMGTRGFNEEMTLANMDYHWGDALRAGDFICRASGEILIKIDNSYIDDDNGTWDDAMFINKPAYWFAAEFNTSFRPRMELPDQEHLKPSQRKCEFGVDKMKGYTTTEKAAKEHGWTSKSGGYTDKTGGTVSQEDGPWGSNAQDPIMVTEKSGTSVYTMNEDGSFKEVASIEGKSIYEVRDEVRAKANNVASDAEAAVKKNLQDQLDKDAEITTRATNFGAITWGGGSDGFPDGKPVAFGEGKYHVAVYAKGYPAFAPPIHRIAKTDLYLASELGYDILQTDTTPIYPIGMVAYSETYLSWRFVEDYLLSELYMPRAVQPGLDKNNDAKVALDTIFASINRCTDKEKKLLNDTFLQKYDGLLEKQDDSLTDESKAMEVYHSGHIINHPALRSFNPEICILPGQESLAPFDPSVASEDLINGSKAALARQCMLDGDGFTPMSDALADPMIKGDTVLNRFAGINSRGEYDDTIGTLRNIMINSDLLEEAAAKSDNVRKFCLTVLKAVNKACGEPWEFKMLTNSALGKVSIIDENYTPAANVSDYTLKETYVNDAGVYTFSGIGSDNILKDVKIQSKIPTELQTMAYYSTMGTSTSKGDGIQMFNMYRAGIVDRLRSISNVTVLGNRTGSIEAEAAAETALILAYTEILPLTRQNQTNGLSKTEASSEGQRLAKQFVQRYVHGNTALVQSFRPPIPIDVSLTLHGVSGIYMGNAIMIKTIDEGGILPSRYKNNVALQATSVDHAISPEGWTTSIGTLMRPLADSQKVASPDVRLIKKSPAFNGPDPSEGLPVGNPYGHGNKHKVTSPFASQEKFRNAPHGGLDIGSPVGTPLVCCLPEATLTFRRQVQKDGSSGDSHLPGYGYYIELTGNGYAPNGSSTRYTIHYGHCEGFIAPLVDASETNVNTRSTNVLSFQNLKDLAESEGWGNPSARKSIKFPRKVKYGEIIASSGGAKGMRGAGSSTGPHMHMTIKKSDSKLDPQLYVNDFYVTPGGNRNDHLKTTQTTEKQRVD